ncbi:MAG: pyridoxamine 5'-phosphate oxidase family protein [Lachnospiraceae bacterium]|nr:pyridoxamine 5'-phosphate oxidase family protein [Lachnospiraceae bacterium]
MWEPNYEEQANYWTQKEAHSKKMDPERLKEWISTFISERKTCALATAADDFVRCTPIEYNYVDGAFFLFSEGGLKFKGLKKNKNVCLAIFDGYSGFGKLKGLQVQGKAVIIEPFSPEYTTLLEHRKISIDAIKKLPKPMNLIKVDPKSFDLLDSELKKEGVDSRQHLEL